MQKNPRNHTSDETLGMRTTRFSIVSVDYDEMARVNEGRRVSSKGPLLVRAGKEEGARKRMRLDASIPIWDYIFKI